MAAKRREGQLTWEELWAIREAQEDPVLLAEWEKSIGVEINPRNHNILISREVNRMVEGMTLEELSEFLKRSPIELLAVYFHKLPIQYAKKVLLSYSPKMHDLVKFAYNNPRRLKGVEMIEAPKHE